MAKNFVKFLSDLRILCNLSFNLAASNKAFQVAESMNPCRKVSSASVDVYACVLYYCSCAWIIHDKLRITPNQNFMPGPW